MFFRHLESLNPDRILVVSLSNIGDVVLTFPVLDALRARFPSAAIDVVIGPKAAGLLAKNKSFNTIVYDKKTGFLEKWRWLCAMRAVRFDGVVDLRNSMLPFLLRAGVITPPSFQEPRVHMRKKHLARLELVLGEIPAKCPRYCGDGVVRAELQAHLAGGRGYVVIAPGAADRRKRWPEEKFAQVVAYLCRKGRQVVLLGDQDDALAAARIAAHAGGVINLCGKTNLDELAPVIDGAALAITNDSAIMHVASYMGKPVVALFGPTDPSLYGPWSVRSVALKQSEAVADVSVADVLAAVERVCDEKL